MGIVCYPAKADHYLLSVTDSKLSDGKDQSVASHSGVCTTKSRIEVNSLACPKFHIVGWRCLEGGGELRRSVRECLMMPPKGEKKKRKRRKKKTLETGWWDEKMERVCGGGKKPVRKMEREEYVQSRRGTDEIVTAL